jgi:hypothetical protein
MLLDEFYRFIWSEINIVQYINNSHIFSFLSMTIRTWEILLLKYKDIHHVVYCIMQLHTYC